jgi:hypothetical protein
MRITQVVVLDGRINMKTLDEYKLPPKWVRVVYKLAQWADYKLSSFSNQFYWRCQGLYDDYCHCDHCEERRAKGLQREAKG